jgi:hypothetical protein
MNFTADSFVHFVYLLKSVVLEVKDKELYAPLFDITHSLIGLKIEEVLFYLDDNDMDFTEQNNEFGKSLLSGFDVKIAGVYYSIGNRFTSLNYGVCISKGRTIEFEFIESKKPVLYPSFVIGQIIRAINIYWMKIPFEGVSGYYPQEIEIKTDLSLFLISSIEINDGQVNTKFTDELLIVENTEIAKRLELGHFGISQNEREYFSNLNDIKKAHCETWE